MKKIFTLAFCLLFTGIVFGQITINYTDIPQPQTDSIMNITGQVTAPVPAVKGSWDVSAGHNTPLNTGYFYDTTFKAYGITELRLTVKNLSHTAGYYVYNLFSFNNKSIIDSGSDVPAQNYTINTFTGGTHDSLNFPSQAFLFNKSRALFRFPFTYKSAWKSVSPRAIAFYLTDSAAKLTHQLCEHRFIEYRTDTIIGYGTMNVYTPKGKSPAFDVLIDRVKEYDVDSFYSLDGKGGKTAFNNTLLSIFTAKQGQYTDSAMSYSFIRKGSFPYLYTSVYSDGAFSKLTGEYVVTTGLSTGVGDIKNQNYSVVVYPNPSNGREINVHVIGKTLNAVSFKIYDLAGRNVFNGQSVFQNGVMHLNMNTPLPSGNYILSVIDPAQNEVVNEQIAVGSN